MKSQQLLSLFCFYIYIFSQPLLSLEKPNILWITAEDMSPVLGCYGDQDAITPNIDKMSEQSVKFTHAFASAPVCSPSRSCLIQGALPPSMGTQHMRSGFPCHPLLPDSLHCLRRKVTTQPTMSKPTIIPKIISKSLRNPGMKAHPQPIGEKGLMRRCLSFLFSI